MSVFSGAQRLLAGSAIVALLAATPTLLGAPAPAAAAVSASMPLTVTEIAPDNEGVDNFEYFEVTNYSAAPVDLSTWKASYIYADDASTAKDVPFTLGGGDLTVAAGESVVVWLQYTSGSVDTSAYTAADFRQIWGDPASTYRILTATGQPGMANGGDRGVRLTSPQGSATWSYYPSGSVAVQKTAQFSYVESGSATLEASKATATPGSVAASGTTEPTDPTDPTDPGTPPVNPGGDTTKNLLITELLPDSSNIGGGDAYEFIEITNPTNKPVSLADYRLVYGYPEADLTVTSDAQWLLDTPDAVVQPGASVVVWVKNGVNQSLTAADFNAKFGTSLVAGTTLIETQSGGMANGSLRSMDIRTNTGFVITRVYYNETAADDTEADKGIRYGSGTDLVQPKLSIAAATPGSVGADQIPAAPVAIADDTSAPAITNTTASVIDPNASFPFSFTITDNVQVRTVTLTLTTSAGDSRTVNLTASADGTGYSYAYPQVDLTGKTWVEYSLSASDGTTTSTLAPARLTVTRPAVAPVRSNLAEGQWVSGTTDIVGSGQATPLGLAVDGATCPPVPSLESAPAFAMEATGVDVFFQNAIMYGGSPLKIFDDGIYSGWETISSPVPLEGFAPGQTVTVSVTAGTKAHPGPDDLENNDDFSIRDPRLILPDGRTLVPSGYSVPGLEIKLGDSDGLIGTYDALFTIPDDAFTSVRCAWDTSRVADGAHQITVRSGDATSTFGVNVDNTAPVITPSLQDGGELRGAQELNAEITDGAGQGIDPASVTATLDGEKITLPHPVSSTGLSAGEHTFTVSASDLRGNATTSTVTFTVPVENPSAELVTAPTCSADGVISVTDPSGDTLDVAARTGHSVPVSEMKVVSGSVHDGRTTVRDGEAVQGDALNQLSATDGAGVTASAVDALPYQEFTAKVPAGTTAGDRVRVEWTGTANPGTRVTLFALDTSGKWVEVAKRILANDSDGAVSFSEIVDSTGLVHDGEIRLMVQNGVGWAGADQSSRTTPTTPVNAGDTPRSAYDATIAWETDTQYYNATAGYYKHQTAIHDYVLAQRAPMNIQYMSHTGDIVDNSAEEYQWKNADAEYQRLDDAAFPYGVLAGNHDVGHKDDDYSHYGQWFGADRYNASPWWGGDIENNRGHYDLVTVAGVDFIYLYMGWGAGDAQIDWMNEVLAQYPERTAVINMHEFLTTTGGRGAIPEQVYQRVIVPNKNVAMVQSGHYHDAYVQQYPLDDNGDGVTDRTVAAVLFDFQSLPEGGQGYLRLQHLDSVNGTITNRTYSPSLDDFDTDDPSIELSAQEFTLKYSDLGIVAHEKTLTTDRVKVDVLGDTVLAQGTAAAGSKVLVPASATANAGSWYYEVTDAYGGRYVSEVFTAPSGCAVVDPTTPPATTAPTGPGAGGGQGTDGPGTGGPGSGGSAEAGGDGSTGTGGSATGGLANTGAEGLLGTILLAAIALGAGALLLRRRTMRRD